MAGAFAVEYLLLATRAGELKTRRLLLAAALGAWDLIKPCIIMLGIGTD
jgi:hypothetical protein